MLREIFVVKNNTTYDVEIKDFGIIIPSGQTAELAEYDKAVMSDELYNYLSDGTLVRYIDNSPVTSQEVFYSTTNNYYLSDEQYGNIINVAITGSSYNTINAALDSITGNTSDNRFLIQVSPDLYVEDITMKPFVTVQGVSTYARIQGKVTFNFTGSTNTSRLENIEVKNNEGEAFDIDTEGIITINSVSAKSTYTLASENRVKSVFNIKRGTVNVVGQSLLTYTNTNVGLTNNIDTIFYVNGTGITNLISFNASHRIITHEKNTFVSVVYNENINTTTDISIKDTYDYFYLNNSNPNNLVTPVIHSGATNNTGLSSSRIFVLPQYMGTTKFMTAYNTNSKIISSYIYNYHNSYTWDDNKMDDTDIYLAAATTILDKVKIIDCFFKTNLDVIPHNYKVDGSVGEISYSITNNSGTQANYGEIRMNSLFVGSFDSYNSGSTIIDKILNEEDLSSNDPHALPTQHSVKSYVDNVVSGVTPDAYVTRPEFNNYTGTTGLQQITEINAETNIESSFNSGIITGKIRPIEDTTTAIQINKSDNTPIINIDTVSGMTGYGTISPESLVHLYGHDNTDTNPLGLQTNGIRIDGNIDTDKDVVWSDNGVPKWMAETYRNENSRFWYLYNQTSDTTPIVASETGRIGINSPSNIMYHYATKISGMNEDHLFVSGTFDKGFIIVYQVKINNVTGTTDTFVWRSSKNQGIEFSNWSSSIECSLTPTLIDSGINVQFTIVTGHTLGDTFQFIAYPQLPQSTFVIYNRGLDCILKTDDYTADVVDYHILTDELNTSISYLTTELFQTGTTNNVLYLGLKVKFDEVFFNLVNGSVGLTLITEYWNGTIWRDISIGSPYYHDATSDLTITGSISWDGSSLSDWTERYLQDYEIDDTYLFWIRFRTVSSPIVSPITNLLSLGGNKRFSIFSAPYDINPSFYVDSIGRVSIGGGNISGKNVLQINSDKYVDVLPGATNSLFEIDSNDSSASDIRIRLSSDDDLSGGITIAKTRGTLSNPSPVLTGDELGHIVVRARIQQDRSYNFTKISTIYTGNGVPKGDLIFSTMDSVLSEKVRITSSGYTGFGIIPNAYVHIQSGTTNAAPLKFMSGSLLSVPQTGAIEFVNDAWYGTITTENTRKTFAFLESPRFIGTPNLPSGTTLDNTNLYNFILTSGGTNGGYVSTSTFNSYSGVTNSQISSLSTSLSSEVSNRLSADSSVSTNISTEVSTRISANSSLSTSLSTEVLTRSSADGSLSIRISTIISSDSSLSTSVSTETSTRINIDSSLSTNITTETSTRISEDSSLSTSISTEVSTRSSVDGSLSIDILAESSNRIVSDNSLSENISSEVSIRASVDGSLSSVISTESSVRMISDNSLSSQISTNLSIFNVYSGSTIPWTQVSKTGSSLSDLQTRNAIDLNVSLPDWNVSNVNDFVQASAQYIEDTQGSGRLTPEEVLFGSLIYPWQTLYVSGGTGYITYTGFHKYITWEDQSFNLSGYSIGNYHVYVDIEGIVNITTSQTDGIHNIRLGSFYWYSDGIATIQQCGCLVLNSTTRITDFALRQGVFIYDNGGTITTSGTSLKIESSACKIQFGLLDQQLSQLSSNDANYLFFTIIKSAESGWAFDYHFGIKGGEITVNRWNDITMNSYVVITGVTVSFTQGSTLVTSSTNLSGSTYDLANTFIYLSDDGIEYMTPVSSVTWTGSQTNIVLETPYLGSTASGTMIADYTMPQLPPNKYKKDLILRTTDGQMFIVMAQTYYDTETEAIDGVFPSIPDSITQSSIKMAYIVVNNETTDLTNKIYDIRPLPFHYKIGGQSGGGASVTIHSQLLGLEADDHLQYIKTDGTRKLTGIQGYQTHPIFTADTNIVDKKYVDDGLSTKVNSPTYISYTGTTNINISLLSVSLSTETSNRNSVDSSLSTSVSQSLTGITSLSNVLSSEVSTRTSVDGSLSAGISTRISVDNSLSTSLSSEVSTRTSVDGSLSAEISTRISVDNSLSTSLSTETLTRTSVDGSLSAGISTRISVDNSLSTSLSSEVSTRTSVDGSLSTSVSTMSSIFNIYTGSTAPASYVGLSLYDIFTGTTNTNISLLSGWTGTKLDISTFNLYSAVTVPSIYLTINSFNTYSGNTTTTLAGKQNMITGAAITITGNTLASNRAIISDNSGNIAVSTTTSTQIGYLSTVTSDVQTQINTKAPYFSPSLSGTPTSTTASVNTNTTQIATTAYVVGQASSVNPLMNGNVSIGTSLRYSREDHIHPSDFSRVALTGATMTGTLNGTNINLSGNLVITGSTYLYNTDKGSSTTQYSLQIDSMNNKIGIDTGITATYYGQNFHYAQDLTTTTTTIKTPTFVVKTGFTTSILPIGTYRITYSCGINKTVTNSDMLTRIQVDDVTLGSVQNHELSEVSTWLYVTRMMFITFDTATTHTVNLEFSQEATGTQSIRDASIELIRVL